MRPRLRADVMALSAKGEIWIVECKSCRADFASDQKWRGYLDWCDRFFWAVDLAFPQEILPPETGLITADGYGAEQIGQCVMHGFPFFQGRDSRRRQGGAPFPLGIPCAASATLCQLLIRPNEVLSGIAHARVLKVADHTLRIVVQHPHMRTGCLA